MCKLSDYSMRSSYIDISCARLGLTSLAYLWMRDQDELLQEMIDKGMVVILIKVAAAGLEPEKHLGKTITELKPHFEKIVFEKALLKLMNSYRIKSLGLMFVEKEENMNHSHWIAQFTKRECKCKEIRYENNF